jgi:pSer/pThr/pTyr-binding forkhead associated (FHA) protein
VSVDVVLFLGRILFLLCLYLFLMYVVLSLSRDLRSNDNTIALPDATVSSRHGRMVHGKKGWIVEDLGSTNGTFVNGQRVSSKVTVHYGDVVSLGGVSMKLVR